MQLLEEYGKHPLNTKILVLDDLQIQSDKTDVHMSITSAYNHRVV